MSSRNPTCDEKQRDCGSSSPVGWYVASYLLRLLRIGEDNENPKRRFPSWENTILIQADNSEEAYRKALDVAACSCQTFENIRGEIVRIECVGLTSLLPIYEEICDGAEIVWTDHGSRSLRKLRQWVKEKSDLEAFQERREGERWLDGRTVPTIEFMEFQIAEAERQDAEDARNSGAESSPPSD